MQTVTQFTYVALYNAKITFVNVYITKGTATYNSVHEINSLFLVIASPFVLTLRA